MMNRYAIESPGHVYKLGKVLASSKILISMCCFVSKAIVFYLHHYIFIALDVMLERIYIILAQYIFFYLSNQLHLCHSTGEHEGPRFHFHFQLYHQRINKYNEAYCIPVNLYSV